MEIPRAVWRRSKGLTQKPSEQGRRAHAILLLWETGKCVARVARGLYAARSSVQRWRASTCCTGSSASTVGRGESCSSWTTSSCTRVPSPGSGWRTTPSSSCSFNIRTHGSSTERQSYDSVKVLPTQTRNDEEAFALPKTILANGCRSADRTAVIPLGRIRPFPTPPSASMRLHGSNSLSATSAKFSRIGPDAFGRYALPSILRRAPAARVPRGIAVTQTSSPARAAALHASRGRPALASPG